jgi:hypothetical protein
MSTALAHHHPHRSTMIAAGAAVVAVVALAGYNMSRDDAPASPTQPADNTSLSQFKLTGGTHEQGNWNHAGTISGGHAPRTLTP